MPTGVVPIPPPINNEINPLNCNALLEPLFLTYGTSLDYILLWAADPSLVILFYSLSFTSSIFMHYRIPYMSISLHPTHMQLF